VGSWLPPHAADGALAGGVQFPGASPALPESAEARFPLAWPPAGEGKLPEADDPLEAAVVGRDVAGTAARDVAAEAFVGSSLSAGAEVAWVRSVAPGVSVGRPDGLRDVAVESFAPGAEVGRGGAVVGPAVGGMAPPTVTDTGPCSVLAPW
jgi:hypothetical protein